MKNLYIAEKITFQAQVPKMEFLKFTNIVKEINKKCSKKGVDLINFKIKDKFITPVTVTVENRITGETKSSTEDVEFYKIEISGAIPHIPGHELLFKLEIDKDGDQKFSFVKGEFPEEMLSIKEIHCDLCGQKRKRKLGIGLKNKESQEIVMLGGECAKDFNYKNLDALFNLEKFISTYIVIKDEYSIFVDELPEKNDRFFVEDFFYLVYHLVSTKGFIPKENDQGLPSTFDEAIETLENNKCAIITENEEAVAFFKSPKRDELISALPTEEHNKINIKTILKNEMVKRKDLGIILLLVLLLKRQKREENKTPSKHVGEIGEKIEINGEVITSNSYKNDFGGYVTYTLIKDLKGNLFETTSSSFFPDNGSSVSFEAKVKKHRVSRSGDRITTLNYPKGLISSKVKDLLTWLQDIEKKKYPIKSRVLINDQEVEVGDLRPANGKIIYSLVQVIDEINRKISEDMITLTHAIDFPLNIEDVDYNSEKKVTLSDKTGFKIDLKSRIVRNHNSVSFRFSWRGKG